MRKFEKKLEEKLIELSSYCTMEELSFFQDGAKWCRDEMEEDLNDRLLNYIAILHIKMRENENRK